MNLQVRVGVRVRARVCVRGYSSVLHVTMGHSTAPWADSTNGPNQRTQPTQRTHLREGREVDLRYRGRVRV